jgi:hypothetical protein
MIPKRRNRFSDEITRKEKHTTAFRPSRPRFHQAAAGPLASPMLSEVGAQVIKIEKPGGEDARRFRAA